MTLSFCTRIAAAAFAVGLGLAVVAPDADAARRFGGGKSVGKQSDNVTKQAPPAAPAQSAPAKQNAAPAATPPNAAAAPQPARNRWLGPLAGIAAGLGIAALLSHFGLAGAFAEAMMTFLLIGLLVVAAVVVFRMLRNRGKPALASANAAPFDARVEPTGMARAAAPAPAPAAAPFAGGIPAIGSGLVESAGGAAPGGGAWTIPAGFEVDDFLHIAKMYFVRMQAAWDAGDERDIRNFTSPEVFAHVKLDIDARGGARSHTEVVKLDAQLLGVEEQGDTTLASVRMSGLIREGGDGPAEPFTEVWNLEKPASARASWIIAGIQQEPARG
ncbi:MAG: Tim44 domain-containing protein [Burkholderiales bacterium]|nr:Tim44 domain-containing protein [Burkholderiales bacterium]